MSLSRPRPGMCLVRDYGQCLTVLLSVYGKVYGETVGMFGSVHYIVGVHT